MVDFYLSDLVTLVYSFAKTAVTLTKDVLNFLSAEITIIGWGQFMLFELMFGIGIGTFLAVTIFKWAKDIIL